LNNGLNVYGDKLEIIEMTFNKLIALFILTVISVTVLNVPLSADENQNDVMINFDITVPHDSLTIGDDIIIYIRVDYPADIELTSPSDQIPSETFILKSGPKVKSKTRKNRRYDSYTYVLTTFETGALEIPAFEFFWYDQSGNQHSVLSPTKPIFIKSVLPADTSGLDIKDIIGPKSLPKRWWLYVLIGLLIAVIIFAVYLLHKRKMKAIEIPKVPAEPPYDIAIRELTRLKEKDLPGKGKIKQYYIELSNIIRRYIEGRFNICAVEATTYELKKVFKHPELSKEKSLDALNFLTRADMVKFAKFIPAFHVPSGDYELVKGFVVTTKPMEKEVEVVK
jgi:hypothetical protein